MKNKSIIAKLLSAHVYVTFKFLFVIVLPKVQVQKVKVKHKPILVIGNINLFLEHILKI